MTKEEIIKPENLVYKKPTLTFCFCITGVSRLAQK